MREHAFLPWILAGAFGAAAGGAAAQEIGEVEKAPATGPAIGRLAFSAKVGSTGPAADLTWGWSRELHGRVTVSYEPELDHKDENPIRATASLLLDWHPHGGSFRLSGGVAYLRREFQEDSPHAVSVASNELRPYFGIGWGNPFRAGSRWKFAVDLGAFGGGGVVYSSGPDSSRASTSAASERSDLRVTASWSPVVSTGVSFRF